VEFGDDGRSIRVEHAPEVQPFGVQRHVVDGPLDRICSRIQTHMLQSSSAITTNNSRSKLGATALDSDTTGPDDESIQLAAGLSHGVVHGKDEPALTLIMPTEVNACNVNVCRDLTDDGSVHRSRQSCASV
jgi:hypothetical protein